MKNYYFLKLSELLGRGVKRYITVNSARHGIISANAIASPGSSAPKNLPCDSMTALITLLYDSYRAGSRFEMKIMKYPTDAASELRKTVHT